MAPKTTKFGPGTLKIGPTATGLAVEANTIGCTLKTNVNSEDPVTYLSGDQEPGATTFDSELTGELATDVQDGAASLFDMSWTSKGETVEFTFVPNTADGATAAGSLMITPLDFGGEKFGDTMKSEFTWPIVGDVTFTYGAL